MEGIFCELPYCVLPVIQMHSTNSIKGMPSVQWGLLVAIDKTY